MTSKSQRSETEQVRIFTAHGTTLYVDPGSSELRHGRIDDSPANATLILDGGCAIILHEVEGALNGVVCSTGHCQATAGARGTTLEIVRLFYGWTALNSGGRFLCAEPDGRVTLSRTECNTWESFRLGPVLRTEYAYRSACNKAKPTLSISCVETRAQNSAAVEAIERTVACVKPDVLYWFSNTNYPGYLPGVQVENVLVPDFSNFMEDVNHISLCLMPQCVKTDFNLTVQPDGFAVNSDAWDDRFLDYDYVGAVWPWMWGGGPYWRGPIVGNGGFSLRSRRLYDALIALGVKWQLKDWSHDKRLNCREYYATNDRFVTNDIGEKRIPEDLLICLWYRDLLEREYAIRFCPPELANKFSVETDCPFTSFWLGRSFGFHGRWVSSHYGITLP